MRAIDRGAAPATYSVHGAARHDLADRLGYYCSYCEMGVNNMIEVEHIHPVANGGNALDWGNFLLSCKYCNTVKNNNNPSRVGYFWPDVDNTDLLFSYTLDQRILEVVKTLSAAHQVQAKNVVTLIGLDRYPGGINPPTEADTRWRLRDEAMITAQNSFNNWVKVKDDILSPYRIIVAGQIALTSKIGFYSIWCEIFKGHQTVLDEIDAVWKSEFNNFKDFAAGTSNRTVRAGGTI